MCNLEVVYHKGRYVGHIQWESTRKAPTEWSNLYGAGVLEMGDYNVSWDGKKITDTACPI